MTATRPLRILVVDDDPAMVGAITALVGTEGHQVITAYDGLTAVKRYRDERPDIVLLDLAMPGPDGDVVPHLQLVRVGWPAEADPDLLWLKPHIARLRSKLQAAGGPRLVPVRGVGYRLDA